MIRGLTKLGSSYRLRLTLGYVALIALLALAWLASLFGPLTAAISQQQETHLESIAHADALALEYSAAPPQDFVRRVAGPGLRVTLVAADGRVLGDSENDPAKMDNHRARPEIAAALAGRVGRDVRRSATEGTDQMYVAVPAKYGGGPVALRVSETLSTIGALASQARTFGLLALVLAIAVSLFVTARLSSMAAAPVTRLAHTARAIARGDAGPVPREAGELGVVSDALADLAEQVRSRMAESEAEQANLRSVLDGLDDAVLLLEGDVVRIANRSTSRLFKAPFGGWKDRAFDDIGLPAPLSAAVKEAASRGERTVREIGPDASGRTLRLAFLPLASPGETRRSLVVVSDVSERARLEAVRRDFVANASHELKTPASALQLLAESAGDAASDGDVDQALAFVTQMRPEADRLRKLVLDLLDLSRLEQSQAGTAVTDVRAAVDLALTGHRAAAQVKGLPLSADFSHVTGEDIFTPVDPTDVAIALDNLLSNAVAYTESGHVTVSVSADESRVRIVVTDTGVGIPADALPRVFERFYRVDKMRSRESGGTGLGLSLVKHMAERNGGRVSIDSAVGSGTTVTLELPRA